MIDAFDADVLIYAAVPGHPLGRRVAAVIGSAPPRAPAGIGSVLLLPEVLGKPLRDGEAGEIRILAGLLAVSTCVRPTWQQPSSPRPCRPGTG